MKKMRVAMLAPISWRVPPRHYGPWELISSLITEGLVKKGIDVTLFATGDSESAAKLISVTDKGYSEDPTKIAKVWEALHIAEVFERAKDFDIIHNNFDFLPLTYSKLIDTPVVTTIHGFSNEQFVDVYEKYNTNTSYVSISYASRHPRLKYIANVYHGIETEKFTLVKNPQDYLLFFGRIHPDKGVFEAINLARETGKKLIIAGIIQDQEYFKTKVEPYLSRDITYVGAVGGKEKIELLGNAEALLHLISWEEPFGLSMIEAMACGTPVIANALGSVPEVVKEGESGFVIQEGQELKTAVKSIPGLDRTQVRAYVESAFTVEKMVNGYIDVYRKILKK
jgi:glycosyltransferase involved in cell wall biosynthesis